jgi:RNA polymerase sigma-70 factor (ECF subfamily)
VPEAGKGMSAPVAGGGSVPPARQRLPLDPDSSAWIAALTEPGPDRDEALARLHALLVRVARFQVSRRATGLQLRGESISDLATEAADDALVAVLAHLDDFRGASRFGTWACKFAIVNVSATLRRRLWKEREWPFEAADPIDRAAAGPSADEELESLELWELLRRAVTEALTERQRIVLVAVVFDGVPIDVIANGLETTRGAIYKTLHDARRKLRSVVELGETELPADWIDRVSDSSSTARDRSSAASSAQA